MTNRITKLEHSTKPAFLPFSFGQKHKKLLIAMFLVIMLLYVNLGLPYRVRHREERYCYIYWFS